MDEVDGFLIILGDPHLLAIHTNKAGYIAQKCEIIHFLWMPGPASVRLALLSSSHLHSLLVLALCFRPPIIAKDTKHWAEKMKPPAAGHKGRRLVVHTSVS